MKRRSATATSVVEAVTEAGDPTPGRRGPQVIVVGMRPGADGVLIDPAAVDLGGRYGVDLPRRLQRAQAKATPGSTYAVDLESDHPQQILCVGLGDGGPGDLRRAGAATARATRRLRRVRVEAAAGTGEAGVAAFTQGLLLGGYAYSWASTPPPAPAMRVQIATAAQESAAVPDAVVRSRAVLLARDLANTPSNLKSPAWLADQAVRVAADNGLASRVFEPKELRDMGFGGLLAVGRGSARSPRLVELRYVPVTRRAPHVVLIGKGVTFDSGGLSIKPAAGMALMKTDMSGAAAVLGAMSALTALEVPVRVTGLLVCAENLPGADAMRPADVVTHPNGRTTEILNTDAEGRLLLADALAHADRTLRADVLIDVATLTGAATVALGRGIGVLYATHEPLADALLQAGERGGDPLWRLPLVADYETALASPVADSAHVPHQAGFGAGSITAALYLRPFAGGRRWAHLDIAGPARAESDRHEHPKGATGFGTRALLRWLSDGAPGAR